jgi:hypothetical protein
MTAKGVVAQLQPEGLIREWLGRPLAELRVLEGDTPLLLVRLDSPQDELAQVLAAASTAKGERLSVLQDSIGFRTVAAEPGDVIAAHAQAVQEQSALMEALAQRLGNDTYFVVPLKKRRGADRPFGDRIFVGRAHNTDVILRHRSVSKSHAWFEADAEGWKLSDSGSKNGTTRNGKALPPRQATLVASGDELVFGKIETVFAMPQELWDLMKL